MYAWSADELRRISRITAANPLRPNAQEILLPRDATLGGVSFSFDTSGPLVTGVTCKQQQGLPDVGVVRTSIGWRLSDEIALENLLEIAVTTGDGTGRSTGGLSLELSYHGAYFPVTVPIDLGANATVTVVKVGDSDSAPQLIEHLRANRLHYNQAIWRSFDASTVALLLSKFTFEGTPVADLIDPRPIQIAGNYMVFRMPGFVSRAALPPSRDDGATTPAATASRTWTQWLTDHGLTFGPETTTDDLVPVPTGGVFAEAVLGRSNSAEKLDATRFWNWQDSPIPLQPPEIAAISMESRAQPIDVTPGQLGQPVLNIVNPTQLPNPTGLGPILSTLANGSMFRDMSGLAATIGLAQATGSDATGAAADAGKLAAANLATAAQKEIEQDKIAAQLAMAAMGNPSAMQGTPKNISESGAMMNTGDQRDKAKKAAAASGGSSGGTASTSTGGTGGVTSGDSTGGTSDTMTGSNGVLASSADTSSGDLAFNRALFGSLGVPASDLVLATAPSGNTGTGSGSAGSGSPAQFVPELCFYEHVVRGGDLATIAGEVTALQGGIWRPSSVDFRAISIRSEHNALPRTDAEISNAAQFLKFLALPAGRFNFFGYMSSSDDLSLSGEVRSNTIIGGGTDDGSPTADSLGVNTITAFREIGGLSSGGGGLGDALRAIRSRNKDFRDQAAAVGATNTLRELWLAVSGSAPSQTFAENLAKALQMRVVFYADQIFYRPDFTVSPPSINKRGVIELELVTAEDVHNFDPKGTAVDP
jgi:hypothetical protein